MNRTSCPFCGLMVITDDKRFTIHHEEPECKEFAAMVAEAKPSSTHRSLVYNAESLPEESRLRWRSKRREP